MLLHRMLPYETLEFGHQLSRHPPLQIGTNTRLDRLQTKLLQTSDLPLRERLVGEVLERPPPPQGQSLPEHQRCCRRIGIRERPTLRDQPLETHRIDAVRSDLDEVSGGTRERDRALRALHPVRLQGRP